MIEIIPAVLPQNLSELRDGLSKLKGISRLVQIDLVGENILRGEEALPQWEEFDFEFDLMTNDSLGDARNAIDLGASRIVVHADFPNVKEAIEMLQQMRGGDYPVRVGLGLPSSSDVGVIEEYKGLFDYVQVMGIAEVGAQGRPFDPRSLELIAALRETYPELTIQIDGAAAGHVKELVAAGATRLVVGSAIINAEDPKVVYKELYTEANAHGRES